MTELSFAKQFLATLDSRPIKLSSDHVADPRQLPPQPAYILPRMPKPPSKRPRLSAATTTPATPTSTAQSTNTIKQLTLNITVHDIRPTASTSPLIFIAAQSILTSIYDLKTQVAARTGYTPDKIKLLWQKRPVGDSKTLGEVVGRLDTSGDMDLGVMFVGAPTGVPAAPATIPATSSGVGDLKRRGGQDQVMEDETPVAQGQSGRDMLGWEEFWSDLKGFLVQRVRNEVLGNELLDVFRAAWTTKAG